MQAQLDDPPYLNVGTEVSAKYKGAFCEAKVRKVVRNIKCKVAYKQTGLGSGTVSDEQIKGTLRTGATVEVKHPDRKEFVEATITKIQDCSQYTVVFDDGDITTLRRTALCLKSGRHFNEMTLDELPLTNPEHFGNPVVGGGRRGRRRHLQDDSSDEEEEEPIKKKVKEEREENIGKIICVESNDTKKKTTKESWFPALVVSPTAQDTVKIKVKDEYLVRSFRDGRYYTVPKKEATEFTRVLAHNANGPGVAAALEFLDKDVLPTHWDREALFGSGNSSDSEQEYESDTSDDEPTEEKDHFVAQLYKFHDDRGTPLNKVPIIINRDVDLYRLFRTVQKLGGYNRVTSNNQWKIIAVRLGFTPATASITNLVKQAYKKFLHSFEEFNRKLGCTMISTPRNRPTKGRSLVRASSVASPKPKDEKEAKTPTTSTVAVDEPEANDSGPESAKKRKDRPGKVRNLVEKFEEKAKEIKAEEKEKEKEKEEKPSTSIEKPVKAESVSSGPGSSSSSTGPIGPPNAGNNRSSKDKLNKKMDEKRGRKRKDSETSLKKEPDAPPTSSANKIVATAGAGQFKIEVGDKLKVFYHEQKVTYEAKVLDIQKQEGDFVFFVHYTGWNTRYDEWIPRSRISENLSTTKQQKKGIQKLQKSQAAAAAAAAAAANNTTPSTKGGKRSRVHSKSESQPPRSTTPSSVSTKSPAANTRRVGTRGSSARRTSNNTDGDSSLQSDSTDSEDEPIKKSTQRSTSSSAASTTKAIASDKSNVTESSDEFSNGTKGRDEVPPRTPTASHLRSELKSLKAGSPAESAEGPLKVVKNEEISNASTKSNISTASTSDTIKSELAAGVSSDSEFDDDSQSSNKTFGSDSLRNVAAKLEKSLVNKPTEVKKPERASRAKTVEGDRPAAKRAKSEIAKKTVGDKTPKGEKRTLSRDTSNIEKSIPKSVIEKSTAKMITEKILPKSPIPEGSKELQIKLRDLRDDTPDVYEFKEPEPFEFEASPGARKNLSDFADAEKKFKKQQRSPLVDDVNPPSTSQPPAKRAKKQIPGQISQNPSTPQKSEIEKMAEDEPRQLTSDLESAFDVLRKSPSFNKPSSEMKEELQASPIIDKAAFINTNAESSPELKSIDPKRREEKKSTELEAVKKILTDPNTYEPPKIEKPSSIADKIMNALRQKKTEPRDKSVPECQKPLTNPGSSSSTTEQPLAFISKKTEMLKTSFAAIAQLTEPKPEPKRVIDEPEKKPTLTTTLDPKVDILESISPKNTELSETIQKLESAIQKTSNTSAPVAQRYEEDISDSSDSEQSRLIIEDENESQSSGYLQPDVIDIEKSEIKTNVIMKDKNAAAADLKFIQENVYHESPIKPNVVSLSATAVTSVATVSMITEVKKEEEIPSNEPISMLLCEETIPPISPASGGIKDPTENVRKVYTDTGFLVPATHGDRLDDEYEMKKKGGATAENSPRGSYSQDDSKSDSEKNAGDDFTLTKNRRRRQRRHSETETSSKRRRGRGTTSRNGSDSEENSEASAMVQGANTLASLSMPTSSSLGRSPKPCQYNFLVQLDPAMSSTQRIALLRKKIQDLQKTYNTIKSELASIERRRKKLRRREREKQKNAKANA